MADDAGVALLLDAAEALNRRRRGEEPPKPPEPPKLPKKMAPKSKWAAGPPKQPADPPSWAMRRNVVADRLLDQLDLPPSMDPSMNSMHGLHEYDVGSDDKSSDHYDGGKGSDHYYGDKSSDHYYGGNSSDRYYGGYGGKGSDTGYDGDDMSWRHHDEYGPAPKKRPINRKGSCAYDDRGKGSGKGSGKGWSAYDDRDKGSHKGWSAYDDRDKGSDKGWIAYDDRDKGSDKGWSGSGGVGKYAAAYADRGSGDVGKYAAAYYARVSYYERESDGGKGSDDGYYSGKGSEKGYNDGGKGSDDGYYDGGKGSETGYYDGGKGIEKGYYDGGKGIDKSDGPRPRGGKHIRLAKALAIKEIEAGFADYTDEQMRYVNWSKRVQKHVWDEAQRAWQQAQ